MSVSSIVLLAFTGLLILTGALTVLLPAPGSDRAVANLPGFDLQGHRGARGLLPENTLAAFDRAMALGVTTLELDTGVTADGVVVVGHDRLLNADVVRGPDGLWLAEDGPAVRSLTFEQLQGYDVGRANPDGRVAERFPEQVAVDGERMPRLAEVIALAERRGGGSLRYNIETKLSPVAPQETAPPLVFAEAVVAVIRDQGVAERATVQSFDWRTLKAVQEMAPEIATVYLTAERDWLDNLQRRTPGASPWTAGLDIYAEQLSVPQAVAQSGGAVWSPFFRDLRPADLREAQALGLKVVVWTVNDPGDMASLIDLGVDGIITDYPDRLRAVMADRGMALPPAFPAAD